MLAQAVPIGVNLTSPVTWFVIAVACIVLALTISTRRSNGTPRAGFTTVRAQSPAPASDAAKPFAGEWAAAQATFLDDPRAGLRRAQSIVISASPDRNDALLSDALRERYRNGCQTAENPQATTEELRQAFLGFRSILDDLGANARI